VGERRGTADTCACHTALDHEVVVLVGPGGDLRLLDRDAHALVVLDPGAAGGDLGEVGTDAVPVFTRSPGPAIVSCELSRYST